MVNGALTVGDLLRYFRGSDWKTAPDWPPDAFALAISVLRDADAYVHVVESWPPGCATPTEAKGWHQLIRQLASQWRRRAGQEPQGRAPDRIGAWWRVVVKAEAVPLRQLRGHSVVVDALLQLVAAADEASTRAGSWPVEEHLDDFGMSALTRLYVDGTLAKTIDPTRLIVFPKIHTPQRGITSRSLTHHLAVHEPRDVLPRWFGLNPWGESSPNSFNVLVLPWPRVTGPQDFEESIGALHNMPTRGAGPRSAYGFFTYRRGARVTVGAVGQVLRRARALVGRVDAVVFPELALGPGQCERLARALRVIVIGGEGRPARPREPGINKAVVAMPMPEFGPRSAVAFGQHKHHRWCLDDGQLRNYGLGGRLDPAREWWEHIALEPRELNFFELTDWLTFCVLICEDLARQDPVADLLRAVGPNLVVALLMDGPQLENRWAAKYATVLAEDPGSSVLTLTSLGMARLSRPPGVMESRVVALWKDPFAPAVPIEMGPDHAGVVLSLTRERRPERTADGRIDGWASDCVRLHGIHPVEG